MKSKTATYLIVYFLSTTISIGISLVFILILISCGGWFSSPCEHEKLLLYSWPLSLFIVGTIIAWASAKTLKLSIIINGVVALMGVLTPFVANFVYQQNKFFQFNKQRAAYVQELNKNRSYINIGSPNLSVISTERLTDLDLLKVKVEVPITTTTTLIPNQIYYIVGQPTTPFVDSQHCTFNYSQETFTCLRDGTPKYCSVYDIQGKNSFYDQPIPPGKYLLYYQYEIIGQNCQSNKLLLNKLPEIEFKSL